MAASGNVLIGAANQYAQLTSAVNGTVPAAGVLNARISAILGGTGQTVVQLGSGTSVLLNGTGGRLGDLVSLDLGNGRVIGGPQPLIGANILAANPVTGTLATVSAASGNNLLGVTVVNPAATAGSPVVIAPAVAPLIGLTGTTVNGTVGATTTGLVNSTVNGTVTGTLGTLVPRH